MDFPLQLSRRSLKSFLALVLLFVWVSPPVRGQVAEEAVQRTIRLEAFVRSDLPSADVVADYANDLRERTRGLDVVVHDVLKDREQLRRLYELSHRFGRKEVVVPAFFVCDRMYFGFDSVEQTGPEIEALFTADVYTRDTCQRCQAAKRFIAGLKQTWPALRFRYYEITRDLEARQRWEQLARGSGQTPGLPTIHFARRILIGYQGDQVTGRQLEQLIEEVSGTAGDGQAGDKERDLQGRDGSPNSRPRPEAGDSSFFWKSGFLERSGTECVAGFGGLLSFVSVADALSASISLIAVSQQQGELKTLPIPLDERGQENTESDIESDEEPLPFDLELPSAAGAEDIGEAVVAPEAPNTGGQLMDDDMIRVPVFGSLSVSRLGLPTFTLAVGIVDGFNPCAMWILVFLLSVLVNIKDRWKILAVAGTFVVVSGLAYFAFMAAWLELFMLVGLARPVQILLALFGLFIGAVNIKDFFAFKKGLSLSIPESSKPGLYRRVREIVNAKYLSVAVTGAITLAIVVNMVELLCTAGLPALYTHILTMQDLPAWKNYLYLGIYIAAYMFDDALLLTIVIVTLSHRKLQEKEGRWLKLISGMVIFALALVMLFRPDLLQMGQ